MKWKNIFIIAKKELTGFLDSPVNYITLVVFVLFWQFLFFRSVFLIGEASLRAMFDYLPWLLMFFASAITMGVFSQEKKDGTLELLQTHPVSTLEIVLGKFNSSTIFSLLSLFFVIPVVLSLSFFGKIDWGIFLAQYFAAILLIASMVSLDLYISLVLNNQIASLLASTIMNFIFIVMGTELVAGLLPLEFTPLLERLSLLSHYESMSRGVVDLRDLWYFISFVVLGLALSFLELIKFKYGTHKDYYRTFRNGVYLFIGITVLTNLIGQEIPGRIDLTGNRRYSFSGATRQILRKLPDIVTITVYASSKLPSQLVPLYRDLKDSLRDYKAIGKGNIQVIYKDPVTDPATGQEAQSRGVQEIQFNVIGEEELQVKNGYFGLVISYGDKHETIAFLQDISGLEYTLTSNIAKLTTTDKKEIYFTDGHNEKNISSAMAVSAELSKVFEVNTTSLTDEGEFTATGAAVIAIMGPSGQFSQKNITQLESYVKQGGNLIIFADSYVVNPQTVSAQVNDVGLNKLLDRYGINIEQNLVYDIRANETVRMGNGMLGFVLPYPYWLRAQVAKDFSNLGNINNVVLPWAGSVKTDRNKTDKAGYTAKTLLTTSPYAGIHANPSVLTPDKVEFGEENLNSHIIAVMLEPKSGVLSGKIIVVADSDFVMDQFIQNSPANLNFAFSLFAITAADTALTDIKNKEEGPRKLLFPDSTGPQTIRVMNMAIAVLVPVGIALLRVLRRKKLSLLKYPN